MDVVSKRVVVRGIVQGVSFRYAAVREASRLPVTGSVRNLPDGSVEAVFEGPAPSVDAMVAWAHHGPSGAIVDSVEVFDQPVEGYPGFSIGR